MNIDLKRLGRVLLVGIVFTVNATAAEPDLRLVTAAKEQDMQAVRKLLKAGVDVNAARADGSTAFLWAVHWNQRRGRRPAAARGRKGERG